MNVYKYSGSGLADIYLTNGFTLVDTPYGPGVRIEDVDGLHIAIARNIVRQKTPMTGQQLRFLRKEQELTQTEAAAIFRVDIQNLVSWENQGVAQIPTEADLAMRVLYSAFRRTHLDPVKFEPNAAPRTSCTYERVGNNWSESARIAA
ncbi:helix-turn-helix domain-containing protein [Pseudomonas sp. EL_65y_Pfl2_R95]|uniref:helix-turn-helix domain-containing protein n=1 Tax=Pseudomonas sp. EL_65y_Pfl2_R95 TaxID=3088698 RepID=UPI0030DD96D3